VSGINPGANVGGAVYHSGTVGAALTARQSGITGIAISQAVTRGSHLGQGVEEGLAEQKWHSAAAVAAAVVRDIADNPLSAPALLNVNVPNRELHELEGWVEAEVAPTAVGMLTNLERKPKAGHDGAFHLKMVWGGGRREDVADTTDVAAVRSGRVALSWLGALGHLPGQPLHTIGSSIGLLIDDHR
jgi:5'-nucleotidase